MVRVCSLMSKARVWMRNSAFVKEYDWDRLNIMVDMVTGLIYPPTTHHHQELLNQLEVVLLFYTWYKLTRSADM